MAGAAVWQTRAESNLVACDMARGACGCLLMVWCYIVMLKGQTWAQQWQFLSRWQAPAPAECEEHAPHPAAWDGKPVLQSVLWQRVRHVRQAQ